MKIIDLVDKHLEQPDILKASVRRNSFYPSQASCVVKNEYNEEYVAGTCLRSAYWDYKGVKHTNPMTARGARICGVGKLVEKFEVEQFKQMGIWRGNNVKFYNEKYNVSGEADCIVYDAEKGSLRGVEIKSGYDYKFRTDVIGTPTKPGKPKLEHMLQTMIYIDYFKIPFSILYYDRGNAARKEYDITLNEDGTPNIDGKKLTVGLSLPRAMSRFRDLQKCLEDNVVPKRDFQLRYSKEKVKALYDSKRLGKGQREEFEKSKDVDMGDWQCGYCSFKDYCWGKDGSKPE